MFFFECKKTNSVSETLNTIQADQPVENLYGFVPSSAPKTPVSGFSCDVTGVLGANLQDGTRENLLHSPKSIGWDPSFDTTKTLCDSLPSFDFEKITVDNPLVLEVAFFGRKPVLCLGAGINKESFGGCKEKDGFSSIWARVPIERDDWIKPSQINSMAKYVSGYFGGGPRPSIPMNYTTALKFSGMKSSVCEEMKDSDETCIFAEKLFRTLLHPDQQKNLNSGVPKEGKVRILYLGKGLSITHVRMIFEQWVYSPKK